MDLNKLFIAIVAASSLALTACGGSSSSSDNDQQDSGTETGTETGADTSPDSFSFSNRSDVELQTITNSDPITLSGFDGTLTATVTNGYIMLNGADLGVSTQVEAGDEIQITQTSSADFSTNITSTLTVGDVSAEFTTTTRAADASPYAFGLTPITDATPGAEYSSTTVTLSGFEGRLALTFDNGLAVVNGALHSSGVMVEEGDTVYFNLTASSDYDTTVTKNISLGDYSTTFVVTTETAAVVFDGIYDDTYNVGSDAFLDMSVAYGGAGIAEVTLLKRVGNGSAELLNTTIDADDKTLANVKSVNYYNANKASKIASFKDAFLNDTLVATCMSGEAFVDRSETPWFSGLTQGTIDLHMSSDPNTVISLDDNYIYVDSNDVEYSLVGCEGLTEATLLTTSDSTEATYTMAGVMRFAALTPAPPFGNDLADLYALATISITLDSAISAFGSGKEAGNMTDFDFNVLHTYSGTGDLMLNVAATSDNEIYVATVLDGYSVYRQNRIERYTTTDGWENVFHSTSNPFTGMEENWDVSNMVVTQDINGSDALYLVNEDSGLVAFDLTAMNGSALTEPALLAADDYDRCTGVLAHNGGYTTSTASLWCHDSSNEGQMLEFTPPLLTDIRVKAAVARPDNHTFIQQLVSKEEAEQIKAELEGAGAEVEVK
tara:strand:+ start:5814 stop:7802 length:1989 start_codon:yes stop_codon:yes gene_type:complete